MVASKSVLVTGGAGFIGSSLVDRLLALGHRVIVIDDLSRGRLQNLNKEVSFYHTSITNPSVDEIIERERPDVINHQASQKGFDWSARDPVKEVEANIQGSVRLIEAARRHGVGKFIYASTWSVYGEPEWTPCFEDHAIRPVSTFALSKYVVEEYLRFYNQLHRLDYRALRYGNVYGPRHSQEAVTGVVAQFIDNILEGKQPKIFGSGEHERDFVYLDDAVEANILAMENGKVGSYNISAGRATSVNDIFSIIKNALKYRWSPVNSPARPGEVSKIYLDISKAETELGWTPMIPLEEGIRRIVEALRHPAKALV